MFFSSIKGINRLLSKGMSNIYLKAAIEKNGRSQNFDFLCLKKLSPDQFLLQLTQILLNFKTFCCCLKIKVLRAKLRVAFLLFKF